MTIMIGSCDKCYPWELDNLPEAELNGVLVSISITWIVHPTVDAQAADFFLIEPFVAVADAVIGPGKRAAAGSGRQNYALRSSPDRAPPAPWPGAPWGSIRQNR